MSKPTRKPENLDNPATPDADLDPLTAAAGAFVQESPPQPDEQPDGAQPVDQGEPVIEPTTDAEDDEKGYDENVDDDRELPPVEDDGQDDADPDADAEDDGDDGAEADPDDPFAVEPVEGAINPATGEPA